MTGNESKRAAARDKLAQEPVTWAGVDFDINTTPPQRPWVGLTEERIKDIWLKGKDHGDDWLDVLALARSFEAELKEKNGG